MNNAGYNGYEQGASVPFNGGGEGFGKDCSVGEGDKVKVIKFIFVELWFVQVISEIERNYISFPQKNTNERKNIYFLFFLILLLLSVSVRFDIWTKI